MEHQLVIFDLEQEKYGVDIATVESIIKMQEITQLPYTPDFMEGVTKLRGAVIPVIDLRKRFDLPVQAPTRDTRIVISNLNNAKVGLVVDAVTQVIRIADEAIEPPPQMSLSSNSAFIKGIAKVADTLIILLDLSRVLSLEEKEALSSAVSQ
ncbi:MAG: chemotaxis protein CheW [Chloroflexi bacterium]|nr:chemotaxis protein CheW [Chloroflexota bacterium]